jgi:hypothetical protein
MFSLRGKTRAWIDDLASGRVHPFAEIIIRLGMLLQSCYSIPNSHSHNLS